MSLFLKLWLHTALGCNHQSFACPSYSLDVCNGRICNSCMWLYCICNISNRWKMYIPREFTRPVVHPDGLGGGEFPPPPKKKISNSPQNSAENNVVFRRYQSSAPPKFEIPLQSQGVWMKHCTVFHPDGLGVKFPPPKKKKNFKFPPKLSRQQCCVQV